MNDEQQLYEMAGRLEAAWNAADATAWAAEFAADADFIHVLGSHFTGREAIAEGHRTIFSTIYQGSSYALEVEKIRLLAPDVAVVFTQSKLRLANGVVAQSRPTLIATRRGNRWEIVSLQNTLVGGMSDGIAEVMARHPYQADQSRFADCAA